MRRLAPGFAITALLSGAAVLLAACGSGGPPKPKTPIALPTQANPVASYRDEVTSQGQKLLGQVDQMTNDMLGAEQSQTDPKWPGVLTNDFKLIQTTANNLKSLKPPNASYQDFQTKLNSALDTIIAGTNDMSTALTQQSADAGSKAFDEFTNGKTALQEALAALPTT